jgi:uncharacterized membrane protein
LLAIASGLLPSGALVVHPMIMDTIEGKITGVIDYLSSTLIFDFMSTKYKINYSHWESFMSYLKNNSNVLHISTVKQGLQ